MKPILAGLLLLVASARANDLVDDGFVITEPGTLKSARPDDVPSPTLMDVRPGGIRPGALQEERDALRVLVLDAAGLLSSNQVFEAAVLYHRAARRFPDSEEAVAGFAACLLLAGDAANAAPLYAALVQRAPTNDEYRFNLAASYLQDGQFTNAVEHLNELTLSTPTDARVWYNLGIAAESLGQHSRAQRDLARSLGLDDSKPFTHLALARVAVHNHDPDTAEASLRAARRLMRTDAFRSAIQAPVFLTVQQEPWFRRAVDGLVDSFIPPQPPPNNKATPMAGQFGNGKWKEGRSSAASLLYLDPTEAQLEWIAENHASVGIRGTLVSSLPPDHTLLELLRGRKWDVRTTASGLPAHLPTGLPDLRAEMERRTVGPDWGVWGFDPNSLGTLGSAGHRALLQWLGSEHARIWCAPVRDFLEWVAANPD